MQINPAPHHIPAMAFMGWPGLAPSTEVENAQTSVIMARRTVERDRAEFVHAVTKMADANRAYGALRQRGFPNQPRCAHAPWMNRGKADAFRHLNLRRRLLAGSERNLARAEAKLAALTASPVAQAA